MVVCRDTERLVWAQNEFQLDAARPPGRPCCSVFYIYKGGNLLTGAGMEIATHSHTYIAR